MIISRIILKNWRNFPHADVPLGSRIFLIGPNACGKSNFLDAFRFLRDIAKPGGGLQSAVKQRGGLSKIRSLSAPRSPDVEIEVHFSDASGILWKYRIGISQLTSGHRYTYLTHESVMKGNEIILNRPDEKDRGDELRLTQTHLEQIIANTDFREISKFLNSILYLHLVPQLIRHPDAFAGQGIPEDPFGRSFLERMAKTPQKTRKTRLKKIGEALRIAVPQLQDLSDTKDELGVPHLEAVWQHWRPNAGKQREDQFSDGTLRLIGLLWSLLENDALLLLEEPELSLNSGIVRKLPALLHRFQSKKKKSQIILSTHSYDLLSEQGIGAEEVLMLKPEKEGTAVVPAASDKDIRNLLGGGMSIADAVIPAVIPDNIHQLDIFI